MFPGASVYAYKIASHAFVLLQTTPFIKTVLLNLTTVKWVLGQHIQYLNHWNIQHCAKSVFVHFWLNVWCMRSRDTELIVSAWKAKLFSLFVMKCKLPKCIKMWLFHFYNINLYNIYVFKTKNIWEYTGKYNAI